MRRGTWIWMAVALLAVAGCRKQAPLPEASPVFTNAALASGSTGDAMAQLAKKYDIPLYPGAMPDTSHFNATANMGARVYFAYTTTDQADKVVSFYKGQMGMGSTISGAVTILSGTTRNGSGITINVGQKMDGSGTSFAFVISPVEEPRYDDPVATPQTYAANTPYGTNPIPPEPAPKEPPQDTTTYYIPTDRADVGTEDGYSDDGVATTDEQSDYQDQGEITESDPPG